MNLYLWLLCFVDTTAIMWSLSYYSSSWRWFCCCWGFELSSSSRIWHSTASEKLLLWHLRKKINNAWPCKNDPWPQVKYCTCSDCMETQLFWTAKLLLDIKQVTGLNRCCQEMNALLLLLPFCERTSWIQSCFWLVFCVLLTKQWNFEVFVTKRALKSGSCVIF